jgi:hypothetical protein
MTKIAGSGAGVRGMVLRIRIRTKMSQIRSTDLNTVRYHTVDKDAVVLSLLLGESEVGVGGEVLGYILPH